MTTTKLRQNITWAMKTVQKPSSTAPRNPWTKIVRRLAPRTISGVAIGTNTSVFAAALPRKRCRTRAKAIIVPRMVATSVDSAPIRRDTPSASHTPWAPHGSAQCLSVGGLEEFHTMFDFL